ncbi:hypothetical protein EF847_22065 [Actinobacteria bacterium YIM 96077]|uniref:Beta family protein n=1 Tax=Phytoactinopolyspora halophila TaxID=1981511 RepID=A0A329QVU9_9ACTN|nr:beta family protein [Phytoactinopolyspora halophila]AYY14975.1 hypothetical protein EF847_22065 [Actinobacteria bacterium YIM 96077]RAW15432.1 hypothetical protein DPM12_09295 [Phytoactinopolyspora halophila]
MSRYLPVLKGRQAELDALRDAQPTTVASILPLVEIVPTHDVQDQSSIAADCRDTMARLADAWPSGRPVLVDGGLLDLSVDLHGNARGALWELIAQARDKEVEAIPVLHLGDDAQALSDVAAVCEQEDSGICVRLNTDDLDDTPSDLESMLGQLMSEVGVEAGRTDLVFDIGYVDGDVTVRHGVRLVQEALDELPDIDGWRTITVLSGASPADLSAVTPWEIVRHRRYDAILYDRVVNRSQHRPLLYGDYTTAHPTLCAGTPFRTPPHLRYATTEDWLVIKGQRNSQRGDDQFYEICDVVSEHHEFAGASLGHADERIANARAYEPETEVTWQQLGMTHHLDFVASRFATFDEP